MTIHDPTGQDPAGSPGELHSSGKYPLLQKLKFVYDVPFTMTTDYTVAASVQLALPETAAAPEPGTVLFAAGALLALAVRCGLCRD